MAKRWARPRAIATLGWSLLIALVAAAGSWFGADHFFPAQVSASLVAQPTGQLEKLSEESIDEWMAWHASVINDQPFRQSLARRLGERRLDAYRDVEAITARLVDDLTIDPTDRGRITYILAGDNPEETVQILDVLGTTIVAESRKQFDRARSAPAELLGERYEGGLVRYATLSSVPIQDRRLMMSGAIFAGIYTVLLVIAWMIYTKLVRAKYEFDEDGTLFTDDVVELAPTLRKGAAETA